MKELGESPHWRIGLLLIFMLLVLWVPRGFNLDHFVTADEPKWLARSGNFYYALMNGDLANTFTREHPGVTTMWAGTLGFLWRYPDYAWETPGILTDSTQIEKVLRANGVEPIDVLEGGRVFVVLIVVVTLVTSFWLAVKLLGLWTSFVGFIFIALDPFLVGLTRILHLDGLMSSFMLLSVLGFLNYLNVYHKDRRDRSRWIYLTISGVAAGLSWLTKSPALFLAPFLVLVALIYYLWSWYRQRKIVKKELWEMIKALAFWAIIGCAVFVLLFPAMWVTPLQVVERIIAEATTSASGGHTTTVFFDGRLISGDPAIPTYPQKYKGQFYYPLSYLGHRFYPLVYLWRATPAVLVGLTSLLLALITGRNNPQLRRKIWIIGALGLFAILFMIFMDQGAKKFDRYLLPIFIPLDLLAGLGLVVVVRWARNMLDNNLIKKFVLLLTGLLIILQVFSAFVTSPYYFSYYNPLMGGGKKASEVLMVGWGEVLDQAARYLNINRESEDLKVLSYYPDGCFSYFFEGETIHAASEWDETLERLASVDYVVLYIHQWQRQLPFSEMLDFFGELTPVEVITINDIAYAEIYDMREVPLPK
ncbi:MAG: glycosyltransferase family 39 protein [Anaerolineaceae bacterium]|nr:glycosyltransferase family 39 protein [Anaerolineaceae bacterium]